MKHSLLRPTTLARLQILLFGSAVFLGSSGLMSAAPIEIQFQVANLTASGGDPVYDVASNVTFNNLSLTELFADSTSQTLSLFDGGGIARQSLDTSTILLSTPDLASPDPVHGAITQASLTGTLSTQTLSILTSFGGAPVSVTVLPGFTASLSGPAPGSTINLLARDANGGTGTYAIGTFSAVLSPSPAAVPEPATWSLAAAVLGVACLARGFVARRNQQKSS